MHPGTTEKGAVQRLFYRLRQMLPALLLAILPVSPLAAEDCPAQHVDEQATVRSVTDGDTLVLDDGRRLRLIGIDTPELAHHQNDEQPFAREARQALAKLLPKGTAVSLQYGIERHDRYHRLLAHVFTRDGVNLNAEMIRRALAVAFTTPPNDALGECYRKLEHNAANTGLGIWSDDKYRPVDSDDILAAGEGFRRIRAHIRRVAFNGNGAWLYAGNLGVHIVPRDLGQFDLGWLKTYEGKTIALRGWLRKDRYKPASRRYLRLRHPQNIESPDEGLTPVSD